MKIEKEQFLFYNNQRYELGLKNQDDVKNKITCPYTNLRNMILGQQDFIKKQNDIIRFALKFTREPYKNISNKSDEDLNWRYCIQTNTKLLPAFLYTLASAFVEDKDNYLIVMERIIKTNGKLSDDGDSWVDEYSGRIIRKIDYNIEYEDKLMKRIYKFLNKFSKFNFENINKTKFDKIYAPYIFKEGILEY
jgi:hypothetical protein